MASDFSNELTWIHSARAFAREAGVDAGCLEILNAFRGSQPRGGPSPGREEPFTGSFEAFERLILRRFPLPDLANKLASELSLEVNGSQADMFTRRAVSVERFLIDLGGARSRLLRVGLLKRLEGILAAPPPRALRIRALIDYYYSHAARLYHARGDNGGPPVKDLVSRLKWKTIAPGLLHGKLRRRGESGPVHANFLKVDPGRINIRVEDCREARNDGLPFDQYARTRAMAAVSGGFFLYTESDIAPPSQRHDPVGLLLSGGVVLNPPVFRRASLLVGKEGRVQISPVGPEGLEIEIEGQRFTASEAWNRARGPRGPDRASVAIVSRVVAAVGRALETPLNGFVVPTPPGLIVKPGDRVGFKPPRMNGRGEAVNGVAGGPMIVRDGRPVLRMRDEDFWGAAPPVTFSQDETNDQNLLARMAAGLDSAGRLIFAAVDGRNFERALGMSLGELARLLIALGCHTAMNLDGGSSKRMVVDGEVVDLPSTEVIADEDAPTRIRPVHTAIFLNPR